MASWQEPSSPGEWACCMGTGHYSIPSTPAAGPEIRLAGVPANRTALQQGTPVTMKPNNPAAETEAGSGAKTSEGNVVKIFPRRHIGSPKPSVAPPSDGDDPGP